MKPTPTYVQTGVPPDFAFAAFVGRVTSSAAATGPTGPRDFFEATARSGAFSTAWLAGAGGRAGEDAAGAGEVTADMAAVVGRAAEPLDVTGPGATGALEAPERATTEGGGAAVAVAGVWDGGGGAATPKMVRLVLARTDG